MYQENVYLYISWFTCFAVGWLAEYLIRYDQFADALYIRVREDKVVNSDEISDGIIVDYNEDGDVIGIEILEFSKRKIDLNELIIKGLKILVSI